MEEPRVEIRGFGALIHGRGIMPNVDLDCREANKQILAEAETHRLLKQLQLPRNFAPPDLPKEFLDALDNYEPKADSLKLKKHLLAIQQQCISVRNTTKAMNKIVELCDSSKPQVAFRAAMTLLKLSHLDDPPDLYPITPKYLFPNDEEPPQKKNPPKKPPVSNGAGTTVPPATTLNIENIDVPFFDFQQFHLTLPQEIENGKSKIENPPKPHPFHLTTPFITIQSLANVLILILILIVIPPASAPPAPHPRELQNSSLIIQNSLHTSPFPNPLRPPLHPPPRFGITPHPPRRPPPPYTQSQKPS